jgi:hypothetical protein
MLAYRKSDFNLEPRPFYTPNIFIRLGLYIFGNICILAALGLLFLMTGLNFKGSGPGYILIVFSLALIFPLEALMRRPKPFFQAGLEEALLYASLGTLYAGVVLLLNQKGPPSLFLVFGFGLLAGLAALRYVDRLLALYVFGSIFYILFVQVSKLGEASRYLLPALVIFLSAALGLGTAWAQRKESWKPWDSLFTTLRFAALLSGYTGGNYLIVRELSQKLFGLMLQPGQDIPLAFIFYVYTIGLPIGYIGLSLAKKDRTLLHAGFICLAFTVFTYKFYHQALPLEIGMIIVGLCLIMIAWLALRIFKKGRFGIMANPMKELDQDGPSNAESIASLQGLARAELPLPGTDGFSSGGGSFGGGGANGKF